MGPRAARATHLPRDWSLPAEWHADALNAGLPDYRISGEAEKFKDHYLAKSGADARKRDWCAAWRSWCRKATEWTGTPRAPAPTDNGRRLTALERIDAAARRAGVDLQGDDRGQVIEHGVTAQL